MGVMACSRTDCENIMCDTYVDGVGYICNNCINEFKRYLESKGITPFDELPEIGFINRLKEFMKTPARTYDDSNKMTVDQFFNKHL